MSDQPEVRQPVRVAIVEDHELLARSLAVVLRGEGMDVTWVNDREPDDIVRAVADARPDVVLLDLDLGNDRTSLPAIRELVSTGTLVVMMTGVTDRVRLAECVEAGAVGIVSKGDSFERLAAALEEVADRRTLLAPGERDELLRELRLHRQERDDRLRVFDTLTPREREVLAALIDGKSAEQIASDDHVSLTTVRTHIRSVLAKLEVRSQLAAVALAKSAGWRFDET
jgi:two-component system nitrate/nitrite response regulator NarL